MKILENVNDNWQITSAYFQDDDKPYEELEILIWVTHIQTCEIYVITIQAAEAFNNAISWHYSGEQQSKKRFKEFQDLFSSDYVGHILAICLMMQKTASFTQLKEVVKKAEWWDSIHSSQTFSFQLPTEDDYFRRTDFDMATPLDEFLFDAYGGSIEPDLLQKAIQWTLNTYTGPVVKAVHQYYQPFRPTHLPALSFTHFSL